MTARSGTRAGFAGHVSVEARTRVRFSVEFIPGLPDAGGAAVLRACEGAKAALLVCGAQPSPADRALWENLDAQWRTGRLGAVTRMRLPDRDDGFGAVGTVIQAALQAGLARRDVFIASGGRRTAQVTTLAAAMFRRHTAAVQLVTDLTALAGMLLRGWQVALDGEPVSLPVLTVTALVNTCRVACAAAPDAREAAAVGALAARLPAVAGLARQLVRAGRGERTAQLRNELLQIIHNDWPSVLPSAGRGVARRGRTSMVSPEPEVRGHRDSAHIVHSERDLSFPVIVGRGALDPRRSWLAECLPRGARVLAVVDGYPAAPLADVDSLLVTYQRGGQLRGYEVMALGAAPAAKTLRAARTVVAAAQRLGLGPDDRIVVVGGGTVMDTVGFAAALYEGGTPFIRMPTTLVGLVDAGIGFKVGVDAEGRRNLIGAYHPPAVCLCDPGFLRTLPGRELRCGLAEMIKIAAVADGELFQLIEDRHREILARGSGPAVTRLIHRSIVAMVADLAANPCEAELRRLPDFGHEFGHMLETGSGMRLRHGEGVAIGMALSCELAVSTGWLGQRDADRIIGLLQRTGLPVYDSSCDPAALWHGMRADVMPHKGGSLHLAVPTGIGSGGFIESESAIGLPMLADACERLRRRCAGLVPAQR